MRLTENSCSFRLMQLFCAAVCFLFTSGSPLQASKLTFGSDSDACYAAFLRSLTETFRGLNSCICALTRNFYSLTDASLQASNSGGRGAILRLTKKTYSLQSLRYKHRTRLRLKQRCLLRCVPLFIYGLFCRPLSGTTSFPEWGALFKVKHYLNVLFYQGNEFVG